MTKVTQEMWAVGWMPINGKKQMIFETSVWKLFCGRQSKKIILTEPFVNADRDIRRVLVTITPITKKKGKRK